MFQESWTQVHLERDAFWLLHNGDDSGFSIAVDGAGNAYVAGFTISTDFPTASPFQAAKAGGIGVETSFVTKLNAAGSALVYSTYLGGSSHDQVRGIAVDGSGNAYLAGFTLSTDFPTANAFQGAYGGGFFDAIVTKLNAAGSALDYSTYLGGTGSDQAAGIAVDGAGNAHVVGVTESTRLPDRRPAPGRERRRVRRFRDQAKRGWLRPRLLDLPRR
jgi:hypothetical protein